MLGLEALNSSKNDKQTEEERKHEFVLGTKLIENAFKANNQNSAAANGLCELLLRKGKYSKVCPYLDNFVDLQFNFAQLGLEARRKDYSICRYVNYPH